jgi:hypothetical protein
LRARFFLHLLGRHLRQHPGRVALALASLTLASALMLLLADAGAALRFRVGGHLARLFPEERVRLEGQKASLGPLAMERTRLTPETVKALSDLPDVARVLPIESVRLPVTVQATLFGQEIASDAVIHGVSRELVEGAIAPDRAWKVSTDTSRPHPLVASRYFLDLYNMGLARSMGLPLLSPDAIVGREVLIVFGRSTVLPSPAGREAHVVRAEVVGLSNDPALVGLAMPDDAVRVFNRAFGGIEDTQYVQLVVELRTDADVDAFLREAGRMGLALAGGEMVGRQIKSAARAAGAALIALAIGVFLLGMMTFYLLFAMTFHARRMDLVRLRALGVGPLALLGLAAGEVGLPALVAVAVAGGLNLALMRRLHAHAGEWLAGQSWLPPNLFEPSAGWLAIASAAILAATLLAALPMLRWVFRVEPGLAIRDL